MKKASFIISVAALIVALAALAGSCYGLFFKDSAQQAGYSLYIGTDGFDGTREQARNAIIEICNENVTGFTIYDGTGGSFYDDHTKFVQEDSFVLTLFYTDDKTVHTVADLILNRLNQQTVIIEKNYAKLENYTADGVQ